MLIQKKKKYYVWKVSKKIQVYILLTDVSQLVLVWY